MAYPRSLYILTFMSCVFINYYVTGYMLSDVKRLLKDKTLDYNKMFRPILNQSEAIYIYTGLDLVSIQEFNEVEEKISYTGLLYLVWMDEIFTWNASNYGDLEDFYIGVNEVWIPQMMNTNAVEEIDRLSEEWHSVRAQSNGTMIYIIADIFTSSCAFDVTYYPWDKQVCSFYFMPSSYEPSKIKLMSYSETVLQSYYFPSGSWDLVDTKAEATPDGFMVAFHITIRRKPKFVIVNVILPLMFMSVLNIFVFLIPTESGERISYCLTVLLAIAVFLTLVGDSLPKNAEPMSYYSFYLLSVLVISATITVLTILNLRMYYTDDEKEVGTFWKNVAKIMGCNFQRSKKNANSDKYRQRLYNGNITGGGNPIMKEINGEAKIHNRSYTGDSGNRPYIVHSAGYVLYNPEHNTDNANVFRMRHEEHLENPGIEPKTTWKNISVALDTLLFLLFLIVFVVDTVVFLAIIYMGENK
ncbi:neuronal acetylcholine receptor subunit alpha-7-like [Mya arenaria]|uniref:neuronal acetylcholine receptor subunit alpha-7-like n=1 Tax=Mya arenaria TaxID=6604 RepID=UPI0022E24CFA|nr:neuronal acetylcholine receptor subunit alpha-7-like [Mya arenaria]